LNRKKIFSLFAASLVILSVLSGCKEADDNPLLSGLPVGTWVSSYKETFQITQLEFTTLYYDETTQSNKTSYAGTVENIRQNGDGAGYITIKFTTPGYEQTIDHYYVISWRNRKAKSVELAGAYKADGPADYASKDEAETNFTVANGCFATYSACAKQ
jgi:hypothetical protein